MKMKILSFLLAAMIILPLLPVYAAAAGQCLEVSSSSVSPGDTFSVTYKLPNAMDSIYAISAKISFDTAAFLATEVQYASITGQDKTPTGSTVDEANTNGYVGVGWTSENGTMTYPAGTVILTLTLKVREGAALGVKTFGVSEIDISDEIGDSLLSESGADLNSASVTVAAAPGVTSVSSVNVAIAKPVKGGTPQSAITAAEQYTGTISWTPSVGAAFAADTQYSANVVLTAKTGYKFASGAAATVTGATVSERNVEADGSRFSFTAKFPKTAARTLTGIVIDSPPANTSYFHGDPLNTSGMVVKAEYDMGPDEVITGYTVVYDGGSSYLKKGNTRVSVSFNGKSADVTGLTVSARNLTVTGLKATNRAYDGTTSVKLTGGALNGVVSGETVTAVIPANGTMSDAFAGNGKSVNFAAITLSGADAGNYTLTQPASLTVNITPKEQTPVITDEADLPLGGSELNLSSLVSGAQGTVSFTVKSGTAAVLTGTMLKSGAATGKVVITVSISEKDLGGDSTPEYKACTRDGAITVNVVDKANAEVSIKDFGDITYGDANFKLDAVAKNTGSGGSWSWTSSDTNVAAVDNNGNVTIKSKGITNITARYVSLTTVGEATVKLTVNPKVISESDFTALPTENKTYNAAAQTQSVVSSKLTEGTDYTVAYTANINAGTAGYTVTGTGNYTGSIKKSFTIERANPSVSGVSVISPAEVNTATDIVSIVLGFTSNPAGGSIKLNAGQTLTAGTGTYNWTYTPADTKNYNNVTSTVSITVQTAGDPATYTVSFDANGGGGAMADVTGVPAGSYILPENGFTAPADKEFDQWEVAGARYNAGDAVTVSGNITVKAIWKDIGVTPGDFIPGDVNGNGKIDSNDYALAKRAFLGTYELDSEELMRADIDGSGKLDSNEYAMIKRHCLGTYTIPGAEGK